MNISEFKTNGSFINILGFYTLLISLFIPVNGNALAAGGFNSSSTTGSIFSKNDTLNALFLPLLIKGDSSTNRFIQLVDRNYEISLAGKGVSFLERKEIHDVGYDLAAIPDLDNLGSLLTGYDEAKYVVSGVLERTEDQILVNLTVHHLPATGEEKEKTRTFSNSSEPQIGFSVVFDPMVNQILAHTGKYQLVTRVEVIGNKRIDSEAIIRQTKSRAGERYVSGMSSSDIGRIFRMGYFEDIQVDVEDFEDGKKITYTVKEKAIINEIVISGNDEIDTEDIEAVLKVSSKTIINDERIRNSVINIKKLYKDEGFYDTKVETKLTYPDDDHVNVSFLVSEGMEIYVKDINLNGNYSYDREYFFGSPFWKLWWAHDQVIATSEKGIFSFITDSGVLKNEELEMDASRINVFYLNRGFINAKVAEPTVVQEEEWLYVTFDISEGDQYRVGKVDIDGDILEGREDEIRKLIRVKDNEFYSRKVIQEDILRITDYYGEDGYAHAEVNPVRKVNDEELIIDVTYRIQKFSKVYVNRIIINGNTQTRDNVIRREMKIKEKGLFKPSSLRKSNASLYRLDFFEDIKINPEPTLDESLLDVYVEVAEKPTGTFTLGAGYSTVSHVSFMAQVSQNNLFGRGQQLSLKLNTDSDSTMYLLSFTEPRIFDSHLLVRGNVYDHEQEFDDYTRDSKGFGITLGYPVYERWKVLGKYGYDHTNLLDVQTFASHYIIDSMAIKNTSFVQFTLSRDSRDRNFGATRGSLNSFSVKYAGGLLGGDSAYTKLDASSSWYWPLVWKFVYHTRAVSSIIEENSNGYLPVYERFYLGGINTIRGFHSSRISPVDPVTLERIGGDKRWYVNSEILFPLIEKANLRMLFFYDIGNVYEMGHSWNLSKYKHSYGFGFRWSSPLGPLRLEWGKIIDPLPSEDSSNWEFTIGGMF
jgi:outer membrane protein insertion porin family